jgi:ketosteroid isomerase-like protein
MSRHYETPQDAEDAFYDAIEEGDAEALRAVWEDSPEIACLLPMQPMLHGAEVHEAFRPLTEGQVKLDIQVGHIRWVESGDFAVHLVEERVSAAGRPPQPPVYAMNVYRRGASGWRLLIHQNAPTPPPPGAMPPGMGPGQAPPASG